MTGFGTAWFDYDNDGWLDLFIANGAVNIVESLRGQPMPFRQRNQLFHNDGGGRFTELTAVAGPALELLEVSRGAAFGDIDNDGDLDIVVTNNNGPVRLLLNGTNGEPIARASAPPRAAGERQNPPNHWLAIDLRSDSGNRFGAGARVSVVRTGQPPLWRRAKTDGSYLSASDSRVHFGLGPGAALDAVIVEWPDGLRERFGPVRTDDRAALRRGSGTPAPPPATGR